MAIPKSTKKRKVKLARRKVKGLQAPSFEGWEKLDGAEFHRLKRIVNVQLQRFKRNSLKRDISRLLKLEFY